MGEGERDEVGHFDLGGDSDSMVRDSREESRQDWVC